MWPETKPRRFIVWGLTLYSHTHSYIHQAFDKAAKHLGWDSTWLPDTPQSAQLLQNDSFDDVLFLTAGTHDKHIPKKANAFQILHNCEHATEYSSIPEKHKLILQVFTNEIYSRNIQALPGKKYEFWQPDGNVFQMPWATDLLPHEIEANMNLVRHGRVPSAEAHAVFLGTRVGGIHGNENELRAFERGCALAGTRLQCHTSTRINNEESIRLIQNAAQAPAIVGTWQKEKGYIPCRIFKTISYGHFGITNSFEAFDCVSGPLDGPLHGRDASLNAIQDADETKLVQKFKDAKITHVDILRAMTHIRDKHTQLQRIESIQNVFQMKFANVM